MAERTGDRSIAPAGLSGPVARSTAGWWVVALATVLMAGGAGRALTKPLWHDEIFTLYLATRVSLPELWTALAAGVDLNPPLYYVLVRGAAGLVGADAFAVRLPSLIGFVAAALALYVFVRRRAGRTAGVVAAMAPALTGTAIYAYEGRAYGLMIGFAALALLAWQSRALRRWRGAAPVWCALALAAGTLTHYYAVLLLFPLLAGELARSANRRRLDWPMLASLAGAVLPLAAIAPLVSATRSFTSGFWSAPEVPMLTDFFQQLLLPLSLLALPLVAAVAAVRAVSRRVDALPSGPPVEEVVLAAALIALPLVGYALALLVTGAFHGRYVLTAVLGIAMVTGWIVGSGARSRSERVAAAAVFATALLLQQAGGVAALVRSAPEPVADDRRALAAATEPLPVVAAPALVYLPMAHYAGTDRGHRLVYLTKPPEVAAVNPTTSDRALRGLGAHVRLDVQDYDGFVADHPDFYLYGRPGWLASHLLSRGAVLELAGTFGDKVLYRVRSRR